MSIFDNPLFLGFDHFENMLDRVSKSSEGYPPYNIEQLSENKIRITIAVAGFCEDELDITLENRQLVIRGKQEKQEDRVFLYRGIASRQFQKAFIVSDEIEITGANLENGLLNIDLLKPTPEKKIQKIKINSSDEPLNLQTSKKD